MYAGTNSLQGYYPAPDGGVFKSTNGALNWRAVNDGLPHFSVVLALAVDPVAPNIVYAGSESEGVFKSTNATMTWQQASDGLPSCALSNGLSSTDGLSLAIDVVTPSTLYVGTLCGLYKSTNAVVSWSAAKNGLPGGAIGALAVDPATPSTVYAASSGAGVFKSLDAAKSWQPVSSGIPRSEGVFVLAIDPATPSTVYAATPFAVFKSARRGRDLAERP